MMLKTLGTEMKVGSSSVLGVFTSKYERVLESTNYGGILDLDSSIICDADDVLTLNISEGTQVEIDSKKYSVTEIHDLGDGFIELILSEA